jgi:prepilin-type N-terminal cleavage/methylation domain-containing protein
MCSRSTGMGTSGTLARCGARRGGGGGFTLVEILIVVVIVGILAAIVVANVGGATEDSRRSSFVASLKTFIRLETIYRAEYGDYLDDASTGVCPTNFNHFVDPGTWSRETPIGGSWDTERDDNGVGSALGVHFNGPGPERDDAFMTEVDRLCDDGDLSTGQFRKLADHRYYFVVAEEDPSGP